MATRTYWFVNLNRSRVKSLSKIQITKFNFLNICFLILGRLVLHGAKNHFYDKTTKEELKIDAY